MTELGSRERSAAQNQRDRWMVLFAFSLLTLAFCGAMAVGIALSPPTPPDNSIFRVEGQDCFRRAGKLYRRVDGGWIISGYKRRGKRFIADPGRTMPADAWPKGTVIEGAAGDDTSPYHGAEPSRQPTLPRR